MRAVTFVWQSLVHYRRSHAAVLVGVATAVAVLAGALIVGESVRASLRDLFLSRIGRTEVVVTSSGFFREKLAEEIATHRLFQGFACPLIVLEGMVTHQPSGRRAAGVQVYGVDDRFWKFHQYPGAIPVPEGRDVRLSPALEQELGAKSGDGILLRIEAQTDIPRESLHGRKDNPGKTLRFNSAGVVAPEAFGEFSLRPQQGVTRTIFVSLARLQRELDRKSAVNAILVAGRTPPSPQAVERVLRDRFTLDDLGVRVRLLDDANSLAVETTSMLLSEAIATAARTAAEKAGLRASGVLTYLANSIQANGREIPYSLVTAMDLSPFTRTANPGALVLNDWAARELKAKPGDRVQLEFYVWEENGALGTQTAPFQLAAVVPIKGAAADRNLAPEYPGITEANTLRDWDPPFPMDLGKIGKKDEDYWDRYRTIPKAFISLPRGQQLWKSRFGALTSLRLTPLDGGDSATYDGPFRASLRAALDPLQAGFVVTPVRQQGLEAAKGSTDFGEYFVYFSFFLVASALLLAGLFFRLGVEQRMREIGLLRALGFSRWRIRGLFLLEGLMVAACGAIAGVLAALFYAAFLVHGLRAWWAGAVGTQAVRLYASTEALVAGALGGLLAAAVAIAWALRGLEPATPRSLLAQAPQTPGRAPSRWLVRGSMISAGLGLALVVAAAVRAVSATAGFFGAGALLLIALLAWQRAWLATGVTEAASVWKLGLRSAAYRPGRSVLSIALIASATFLIVALTAFRQEGKSELDKKSGTGGFPLMAESLLPIYYDLNTAAGKTGLNLGENEIAALHGAGFVPFRLRPGDDASCLNLYEPRNPRIIAAPSTFLASGRFDFSGSTAHAPEHKANPWLLLDTPLDDGAIPAIGDANSITYVLHRSLGEDVVLNTTSGRPIRLRMVGALRDSIFQGELVISESNFLRLFPEQQGYRFFLIDAAPARAAGITKVLEGSLSDFGFDVTTTADRLAGFHRVENTYLSIFQTLGGLGLLLGTVGLAAVLLRNVIERHRELALLRAVGYRREHLTMLVLAENALLLGCGLATGAGCALLAIAPALIDRGGRLPLFSMALLLFAVALAGLIASVAAVASALRAPLLGALRSE